MRRIGVPSSNVASIFATVAGWVVRPTHDAKIWRVTQGSESEPKGEACRVGAEIAYRAYIAPRRGVDVPDEPKRSAKQWLPIFLTAVAIGMVGATGVGCDGRSGDSGGRAQKQIEKGPEQSKGIVGSGDEAISRPIDRVKEEARKRIQKAKREARRGIEGVKRSSQEHAP